MLADRNVTVWTYQRDQARDQRSIGKSLKDRVRESGATLFLVSPSTLEAGAAQWMELAYADAYDVPTFVILHHLTFVELKGRERVGTSAAVGKSIQSIGGMEERCREPPPTYQRYGMTASGVYHECFCLLF
jgi:hypothetical protein